MSNTLTFSSGLANEIRAMIDFRKSMGVTDYEYLLSKFDRFCVSKYPDRTMLEREMVLDWIADERSQHNRVRNNAVAIRQLGKHIVSSGKYAYVLPNNFVSSKNDSVESLKTLEDSLQNWLQVFKFPAVERTTYDRAESIAKNQIYPQLGKKVVGDITAADIKKLLNYWMTEGTPTQR